MTEWQFLLDDKIRPSEHLKKCFSVKHMVSQLNIWLQKPDFFHVFLQTIVH